MQVLLRLCSVASHRSLRLLESVVLETLRLRPPAYIVGRCASVPVSLKGFQLSQGAQVSACVEQQLPITVHYRLAVCAPVLDIDVLPLLLAGTTVLVSPYIMHHDPQSWQRPEDFHPGRWIEELGAAASGDQGLARLALAQMGHNGCFVPFGAGPRNCIGTGAPCAARTVFHCIQGRLTLC